MKWSGSFLILAVLLICSEARRDKRGKLSTSRFYRQAVVPRVQRSFAQRPIPVNYVPQQDSPVPVNQVPQKDSLVQQPQQTVGSGRQLNSVSQQQPQPINFQLQQSQQASRQFGGSQPTAQFQQQPTAQFQQQQPTAQFQQQQPTPQFQQQQSAAQFQQQQPSPQFQQQQSASQFQQSDPTFQSSGPKPIKAAVRNSVHPFAQTQVQEPQFANLQNSIVNSVLKNTPGNARLVGFSESVIPGNYITTAPGPVPPVASAPAPQYAPGSLLSRLISNATAIRPNIQEGFTCEGKGYGYYADQINECQIFHVCFPLKDVFKNDPAVDTVQDITYTFSFMCNFFTRFSQDSMTCGWSHEVVPCESAHLLYDRNKELLKTPVKDTTPGTQPGYVQPVQTLPYPVTPGQYVQPALP